MMLGTISTELLILEHNNITASWVNVSDALLFLKSKKSEFRTKHPKIILIFVVVNPGSLCPFSVQFSTVQVQYSTVVPVEWRVTTLPCC